MTTAINPEDADITTMLRLVDQRAILGDGEFHSPIRDLVLEVLEHPLRCAGEPVLPGVEMRDQESALRSPNDDEVRSEVSRVGALGEDGHRPGCEIDDAHPVRSQRSFP